MANLAISNTFVAGTSILASQVNTNFTDVSSYINDLNTATADWDFVSSAGLITAKDGLRSSDETAATPAYSFTSDTDTGMYRITTNTIGISAGGTEAVRVTSGKKMGIGGVDPDTQLHVFAADASQVASGDAVITAENSANCAIQLLSGNASSGSILFGDNGSATIGSLAYNHSTDTFLFTASSANRLSVSSAGVDPQVVIRNIDGAVGAPAYSFSSETDMGMYRIGTDILGLATAGTEHLRIDATGIVTTPQQSGVSAQASGATSIPGTGADTKVLFGTENYDIRGEFASSTFTADTAGIYLVTANILYASPADGRWIAKLFKNGSSFINLDTDIVAGGNTDFNCGGTAVVQLVATDTLEIHASQNSGSAENTSAGSSTYFHIAKVA